MCGIAGVVDFNQAPPRELIERMSDVLVHRGPDDRGIFVSGPVGLGHRRLAIIDVATGHQPILSEDGLSAVVFNGEIYNYLTLQKELSGKGYRFRTRSDTEVILHAYEEYGENCVKHLRGMFCFALWDGPRKKLFLARDRLGIKPLYFYWEEHKFLFASELKAILQDPTIRREIDPFALDDYLTYLYIPGPKTIFKQIRKLLPGHTLSVSPRGLAAEQYWDLSFEPNNGLAESAYKTELLEKLKESVALHLVSEVPVGAFLSGGLDSTAVVGLMAGLLDHPVNTASIGFREAHFDELPYARLAAQTFQSNGYERTVEASAARILDDLVWYFDEPFADSSMVPTYYVSQVARERVKVCLSGDGGDENFAGYRRYRFDVFENRIRAVVPENVRRPLFTALGRMYPKADWLPQVLRGKTLLENLALGPEAAYFHTMSCFTADMKRALYTDRLKRALGGYEAFSVMKAYFDRARDWPPLSRIQYVDIKTYLVDDILVKVDRASMAHSLEVRVPLLDHALVEYAARIPACYKLRNGEAKYIFKRALEGLVPPEILRRRKMGFSVPLAEWLRTELKSTFEERVFSKDAFIHGLFHPPSIRRWWEQHQRGTRNYANHLWALLVLESWAKRFVS